MFLCGVESVFQVIFCFKMWMKSGYEEVGWGRGMEARGSGTREGGGPDRRGLTKQSDRYAKKEGQEKKWEVATLRSAPCNWYPRG